VKRKVFFRLWYYFRNGWSTYFAFIFAAINTLTVTYYLAIEKYPDLKSIFPNFVQYVAIIGVIGIPILIFVGYVHYKKTHAYQSEVDVTYESNPYALRVLINSELLLKLNLQLIDKFSQIMKNEKLTEVELDELKKIQHEISQFVSSRSFANTTDLNYLKNLRNVKI
jgi:hypothetical protein